MRAARIFLLAPQLGNEQFAEEVVRYMRDVGGVDFSDPNWGMERTDVPFSTQHVVVRPEHHPLADIP